MHLKKYVALFFMCLCLIACVEQKEMNEAMTNDASLAAVLANKELRIGVNPFMNPLCFYSDDAVIVGYEIDIAEKIAERLGVHLIIKTVSLQNCRQKLDYNTVDYLTGGVMNNTSNVKKFLFTDPYLRDVLILIASKDSVHHSVADLKGKRIGCIENSYVTTVLRDSPVYKENRCVVSLYATLDMMFSALDSGAIDAAALNLMAYYSRMAKEKKAYPIIDKPISLEFYRYIFRKDDIQLRNAIQDILIDFAYDGTLASVSRKWFGADVSIIGKY